MRQVNNTKFHFTFVTLRTNGGEIYGAKGYAAKPRGFNEIVSSEYKALVLVYKVQDSAVVISEYQKT